MTRKCLQHVSYFQIVIFCYIQFCISLSRLVNFWSFKQRGAVPTRFTVKRELYCYNYWTEMCTCCSYFETETSLVNWREIKKDTWPSRM